MAVSNRPDPLREMLIDILRQLNSADTRHEGQEPEQALELLEVEGRLDAQRTPRPKDTNVASAMGLLLRNGLVRVIGAGDYSWQRQRDTKPRYQITTEGKKFLVEALENVNRVRRAHPPSLPLRTRSGRIARVSNSLWPSRAVGLRIGPTRGRSRRG